ncbi:MAG: type ISP restriction/modification enzyme [Bacteroidia bacterium]|nr:type ISP restriction/modification enzyme [Bacteroidia bacterium]
MRFEGDKTTIVYKNNYIKISHIPLKAYEYVVSGKSAIERVMERYQKMTHKESGITNDPNDWSAGCGNPRYILDLLLSIINVSMQTLETIEQLPVVDFEKEVLIRV